MRYFTRVLIGLLLILAAFVVLVYGSPYRTGNYEPSPVFGWGFLILFAIGFIIGAMGFLGSADEYPALLSGLVLYLIVGAVIAVFIFAQGDRLSSWTLEDARYPAFWAHWFKVAATWPLQLVQRSTFLGYPYRL